MNTSTHPELAQPAAAQPLVGRLTEPRASEPVTAALTSARRTTEWSQILSLIATFLVAFGLMNFAELPLGWKDRVPQISRFLAVTWGLGSEWAQPALWLVKGGEALLGTVALAALVKRDIRWLVACVVGWMAQFTVFAMMDVWAADRAELLEHSAYFVAFTQLLATIVVVITVRKAQLWLQRAPATATTGTASSSSGGAGLGALSAQAHVPPV